MCAPRFLTQMPRINPVATIIGALAGATLLGVIGFLLALPLVAVIDLILRESSSPSRPNTLNGSGVSGAAPSGRAAHPGGDDRGRPSTDVPMAPITGIEIVGPPHDDVRQAGADLLVAARAAIRPAGAADRRAPHDVLLAAPWSQCSAPDAAEPRWADRRDGSGGARVRRSFAATQVVVAETLAGLAAEATGRDEVFE